MRLKFRRSKTRWIVLLLLILFLHYVVISLIRYKEDAATIKQKLSNNLMDLKKFLVHSSSQVEIDSFNVKVDVKFESKYDTLDNKKRFLLDFDNDDSENLIQLPKYFAEKDSKIPYFQTFDPRFTLGILFSHLVDELKSKGSPDSLTLEHFHWSDWADLSILDSYFLDLTKKPCGELFDVRTKNKMRNGKLEFLDPALFCIHDDDMDNILADPKKYHSRFIDNVKQIKSQPFSTGWHIFNFGGRSHKNLKILHSKSYLNDFMAPPSSIVFLLPSNGQQHHPNHVSLNLKVNQNLEAHKKIIHTDLVSKYLSKYDSPMVSMKREVFALTNKLKESADNHQIEIAYEKHLTPDLFIDNSSQILQHLNTLELKGLSASEQIYKRSLEISLYTPQPPKYFNEAKLIKKEYNWAAGAHYDWRFFSGLIQASKQSSVLHGLTKAWLTFTNTYHINTWIAHGSLLAWYWNGLEFPWDNDSDVQMPIADLHKICRLFNQSMIVDLDGGSEYNKLRFGRNFLDCGTYISTRTRSNGNNNIDARFIDVDTGAYIDITGIALSNTRTPDRYNSILPKSVARTSNSVTELDRNEVIQAYNCRNNHFLLLNEISPLKLSIFEGQPAYIPNEFGKVLTNEYSQRGLIEDKFKSYTFLPRLRLWVETQTITGFNKIHKGGNAEEKGDIKRKNKKKSNSISIGHFTDDDYVALLFDQEDLLIEYLLTRNVTLFHEVELDKLLRQESTEGILVDRETNGLKVDFQPLRHDLFTLTANKTGYCFERMILDKLVEINGPKDAKDRDVEQEDSIFEISEDQEQRFLQISQRNPTIEPIVNDKIHDDKGLPVIDIAVQAAETPEDGFRSRIERHPF